MNADELIATVCEVYGDHHGLVISVNDVKGECRERKLVECRQICIYIMREHLNVNVVQAARYVNRDHATATYSTKQVKNRIAQNMEDGVIVARTLQLMRSTEIGEAEETEDDRKETIMTRLYTKEKKRNRKLVTELQAERYRLSAALLKIKELRNRVEALEEGMGEALVDDWTPEQRKALAELRQTHMI